MSYTIISNHIDRQVLLRLDKTVRPMGEEFSQKTDLNVFLNYSYLEKRLFLRFSKDSRSYYDVPDFGNDVDGDLLSLYWLIDRTLGNYVQIEMDKFDLDFSIPGNSEIFFWPSEHLSNQDFIECLKHEWLMMILAKNFNIKVELFFQKESKDEMVFNGKWRILGNLAALLKVEPKNNIKFLFPSEYVLETHFNCIWEARELLDPKFDYRTYFGLSPSYGISHGLLLTVNYD